MVMEEDRSDLFIFDGLFEDKNIDDFLNFSMDDVDADSSEQLLVMDDPSPAYLSWTAEAQALIANFTPPPPPLPVPVPPQHHHQHSLTTTVNTDNSINDDGYAAVTEDITPAKTLDVGSDDASFPCDDDPELAWLSNFVEDSYSPTDTTTASTVVDIPSNAAATAVTYTSIATHFRTSASSAIIDPIVKDYAYDDPDHALLYAGARYRTPSPVSVLDRSTAAGGLAGTGAPPLLIEVPNPKVARNASSASTYSSSSSSSPTSSSCSGAVVSGIKVHGPRSPPESFAQARGRAPRTKRSRPAARPEALMPIVAPLPPPPHCSAPAPLPASAAAANDDDNGGSDHLLCAPDPTVAPIYIPVPKASSATTESTTTTVTLPPMDSSADEVDNTSIATDAPKKKKIKLTITSSAAAAAAAAAAGGPFLHHPATDASGARKCMHCGIQKTPQWRAGPMGPKTLCNACGVRYKSGRLFPEYRPAASPTFVAAIHSNSHKKVVEMRNKSGSTKANVPAGAPVSSKGCELLNYIRGATKTHPPAAAATATAGGGSCSSRDW